MNDQISNTVISRNYSNLSFWVFAFCVLLLIHNIGTYLSDNQSSDLSPYPVFYLLVELYFFYKLKTLLNQKLNIRSLDLLLYAYMFVYSFIVIFTNKLVPTINKLGKAVNDDISDIFVGDILIFIFLIGIYLLISFILGLKLLLVKEPIRGHINIFGIILAISGFAILLSSNSLFIAIIDPVIYCILGFSFRKYSYYKGINDVPNKTIKEKINDILDAAEKEKINSSIEASSKYNSNNTKEKPSNINNFNMTNVTNINDSNVSAEEKTNNYFNSLNLMEYQKIKSEVTKYTPKGLSEEEINYLIKDYIKNNIINNL